MSRLVREIEQCMSGLTEAEGDEVTARFLFPAAFIGFQGHFPERPVLPAVCKIQAAIAVLEAWSERRGQVGRNRLGEVPGPGNVWRGGGGSLPGRNGGGQPGRGEGDGCEEW